MRRGLQGGDGLFNLGQFSGGRVGPSIVEDLLRDGVKITRDEWMEADAVVHAPRAAPIVRRAAEKATS